MDEWRRYSIWRKIITIAVLLFAAAGMAIIGAWALYQLGVTNNRGAVDKNYRYLMSVSEMENIPREKLNTKQLDEQWSLQCARLAAFGRYYPENARLIMRAAQSSSNPLIINKFLTAIGRILKPFTLISSLISLKIFDNTAFDDCSVKS